MPKASISHWIALISRFSRQGLHKETLHLFHQLQKEGHGPNRYVLPSVIRAAANLTDLKTGKILHNLVTRSLLDSDAFISSALIDMYSKCGQVCQARRVFDRTVNKDLVIWNSIISGYACQGRAEDAMVLFTKMRSSGIKSDLMTWNALISGFSNVGNGKMAMDLFDMMQVDGIQPDVFSWTSIICGLVFNFKHEKAFGVFRQMVAAAGIQPSSVTISSLLPAFTNTVDLKHGKELHGYAVIIGVEENLFVSSSLIDMYVKCGLLFEAGKIFDKMKAKSTVTWNLMIFGYANHGYCDHAMKLFYQMESEGVKPDHLTFTAVFMTCAHAGMVDLGMNLFGLMQEEHGIQPRLEHYACIVDLLGRAGKCEEAYDVIKGMPIEPDSFVWGALLGACRNQGNVKLAKIAASHLFELEPESRGSLVLLSNVLVDAGRQGDAQKIKKLLKKRKLKKFQASSWMQVTQ